MERKTFSVVFFCKSTKATHKRLAPIYARITAGGQTTATNTPCTAEPGKREPKTERSLFRGKVSRQINDIMAKHSATPVSKWPAFSPRYPTNICRKMMK